MGYDPAMKAAIVAVGSELLGTDRLDTNSLKLTRVLEEHGAELRAKAVVGDDASEIAAELGRLLDRLDLVLVTGGLGPTADDVTREAAAAALGRGLHDDPEVAAAIERRFREHGLRMPEINRRQALIVDGARVLANRRGTAPGQLLVAGRGSSLFLFPGVPVELEGMIADHLAPWLAARSGGAGRETATLKVACSPESAVEERVSPAYREFGRESITILASPSDIRLRATAHGTEEERRGRLAAMTSRLAELAGDAVYAHSEEETMEQVVGDLLRAAGRTLATAESCTGGLIAERLTRVPGSSDYFLGGAVTYTNALKTRLLGVPEELLAAHGAVSEPVARAMAEGVRRALGGDYGIGVTGVAGPGGGSAGKPVGTVHIALAGPRPNNPETTSETRETHDIIEVEHRQVRFPGDRERVRQHASQLALEMLRRRLLGIPFRA